MNCINSSSAPLLPLYAQRCRHNSWQFSKPRTLLQLNGNNNGLSLTYCRALPCPVLLAAIAPPAGKLSVLLQTGGVCLLAYWVANFVVPGLVLKDLQSKEDKEKEEDERI